MTVTPFPDLAPLPAPVFDVETILAGIDTMAAQKPVAAQLVSVANSEDTSAKELAGILASDVALASRVMKLANSAYFGMRGRASVSSEFAIETICAATGFCAAIVSMLARTFSTSKAGAGTDARSARGKGVTVTVRSPRGWRTRRRRAHRSWARQG